MRRQGVGVVIGRFQGATLHAGHRKILSEGNQHDDLLILVGTKRNPLTKHDPLDFASRHAMISMKYERAVILPLPDQATDDGWSALVDEAISRCFPLKSATLYFGRDSALEHYTGKHRKEVIEEVEDESASSDRMEAGREVLNLPGWRAGVIYAAHNQYPRTNPVVDIACVRGAAGGSADVLVATRNDEPGKHRFPGGHVNIEDTSYEDAARREFQEETGGDCEVEDFKMVGSAECWSRHDDPDCKMMTTLFRCSHSWGQPKASDDVDGLKWIPLCELANYEWADNHLHLARMLQHFEGQE